MKSNPLVSVDCDTLVYSAAASCELRSILVTHAPSGISKKFSNRTEFKSTMKAKNKVITDDYLITDIQEPSDVSHALKLVKNSVEKILDNFSDCEVVLCATASNNFRGLLPYPNSYKNNRKSAIRPLLLEDTQKYILGKYKAVRAEGHEVDDLVGILAYEALSQGREAYILSPDGDCRQFDGIKLGKYQDAPEDCFKIEFMHDITWSDKGIQTWGFPWMIFQGTVGDITDGLTPRFLCKARYGEKGCFNDIKDITSPEKLVQYSIEKYKEWYPEPFVYTTWDGKQQQADWKFMLELYWKGTTMKRSYREEPDFWKFLKDKQVQIDQKDFL